MDKSEILAQFQDFLTGYNAVEKDELWQQQSHAFKTFWNQAVLNDGIKELGDSEIDNVIKFIDKHARGNTAQDEAIAKVMIPQGVWRKMFNQFKTDKKLAQLVDRIMGTIDSKQRIKLINDLYKYNEQYKNSLTGRSGNAINSFLFLWNPNKHVSLVSLNDRQKLIKFLNLEDGPDFEKDSTAEKIVKSNEVLVFNFAKIFGNQYSPRTICTFFYNAPLKNQWRSEDIGELTVPWGGWKKSAEEEPVAIAPVQSSQISGDPALFYMESQLEDFIIENWDKTELGQKYDLIEEEGEIVSQQYRTGVGPIDILAQDKQTKQLVVIELKKNQTSDDTVGQLARYMGWLQKNKTNGEATKGIIIAAQFDQRLYYALQVMPGVEVYLYRVDFKLTEFKETSKN